MSASMHRSAAFRSWLPAAAGDRARTRKNLRKFSVPLLVIVGDEDEPCIDGSVYLKRTALTAGLLVIPRSGHNVPTEEPAMFNAALADLFAAAEAGRWLAHKPSNREPGESDGP